MKRYWLYLTSKEQGETWVDQYMYKNAATSLTHSLSYLADDIRVGRGRRRRDRSEIRGRRGRHGRPGRRSAAAGVVGVRVCVRPHQDCCPGRRDQVLRHLVGHAMGQSVIRLDVLQHFNNFDRGCVNLLEIYPQP